MEESRFNACIQFLFIPRVVCTTLVIALNRIYVYRLKFIISFLFIFLQDDTALPLPNL